MEVDKFPLNIPRLPEVPFMRDAGSASPVCIVPVALDTGMPHCFFAIPGPPVMRRRVHLVPCVLHAAKTAHSAGLVQALHDDLVNLASTFHGTPVHGSDDLLSRRIGINKEPAL